MSDVTHIWQVSAIDQQLIDLALQEDLGSPFLDITTETLFTADFPVQAHIVSKHPTSFTLCGMAVVTAVLQRFLPTLILAKPLSDGTLVAPGDKIVTLQGSVKILLMAERTVLNFLQHLSAVATTTRTYVDRIKHTTSKVLDTRKTTPGFRHLDKYAVACGGGVNHRVGLYDAILIKDNHIDALGGVKNTLEILPAQKKYPTIMEIRTPVELEIVLQHGLHKLDRVLLDNMDLLTLATCTQLCKNKIASEASGNVNLETIHAIAETGVDFISVGKLTHSFSHIDLSMRIG